MQETPMNLQAGSTVQILEGETTGHVEEFGPPSVLPGNQSAEIFSGKKSLGGILVVDDDRALRKLIRLILEDAGYDILEAEDGQAAINMLNSRETPMVVDLIISDLNMPKVDGFAAIASFQKEYPRIPVIILTGIADQEVEISIMRQGVTDYLEKPVDARALIASVANAITERHLSCA